MLQLTERTRHALALARDQAAAMGDDYVGTGHLFLGLLLEGEGTAARALASLGFSADDVRRRLNTLKPRDEERAPGARRFSRPAKMAIECALQEARILGRADADNEHVLLGLIRAAQTYGDASFGRVVGFEDRLRVRNEVLRLVARPPKPTDVSGRRS
jgi:ATP-dependent Clp protease ATP-binding subunit ClpC